MRGTERSRSRPSFGQKNGEWVQTQGLNSLTQPAAYYRQTGDAPEANTVEISVQNAFARRGVRTGFDGKGNGR